MSRLSNFFVYCRKFFSGSQESLINNNDSSNNMTERGNNSDQQVNESLPEPPSITVIDEKGYNLFLTRKDLTRILNSKSKLSPSSKLLLSPPFASLTNYSRNLYMSGLAATTWENIQQNKILCMINVADEIPPLFKEPYDDFIKIYYYRFPLPESNSASILEDLDTISDLINKMINKNNTVLVYCTAGMSRSSSVVLAYAIKHQKKSLSEAFKLLQKVRQYARPNLNYFAQLLTFEEKCLGTNSVQMVQEVVHCSTSTKAIMDVPDIYRDHYPHLLKWESNSKSTINILKDENDNFTGELRPFIVEPVYYKVFITEVEQYLARIKRSKLKKISKKKALESKFVSATATTKTLSTSKTKSYNKSRNQLNSHRATTTTINQQKFKTRTRTKSRVKRQLPQENDPE